MRTDRGRTTLTISLILLAGCLIFIGAAPVSADQPAAGSLIKGSRDTVYYLGADGKRYLFPTRQTFESWYPDFSDVRKISDEELHSFPLGGNVTYRPGVRMIKAKTAPQVYVVDAGGVLRWVKSEAVAAEIYGPDWNTKIDDIPDTLFANYGLGQPIANAQDFRPADVASQNAKIDKGRGAAVGKDKNTPAAGAEETAPTTAETPLQTEERRRSGGALPPAPTSSGGETSTTPTGSGTEETQPPASSDNTATPPTTETTTPPTTTETTTTPPPAETTTKGNQRVETISGVIVAGITPRSATVVWQTNEPGSSFVDYGLAAGAYPNTAGNEKPPTKNHSVTISGLNPMTTYHFRVRSSHGSDAEASADAVFTTQAP